MSVTYVRWLLRLLGFDVEGIPPDAQVQLIWTNQPHSWQVFVLIAVVAALVYLVTYLYRREIDTCSRRTKMFLAALRIAVLLVLVAVYLGPAITYTDRRTLHPLIVLMRDDSQSMNTKDRYLDDQTAGTVANATGRSVEEIREQQPARAALLDEILEQNERRLLAELERQGKLRVANFSTHVKQLETRPPRVGEKAPAPKRKKNGTDKPQSSANAVRGLPKLEPAGQATDLYRALAEGLSDRLTAAVLIFTDGQHTGKQTGTDNLHAIAEKARQQGVPLLFVGIGDPNRPRNLQITDVYADPQVWQGDPFEIQAVLRAQGVQGETVKVALIQQRVSEDADDGPAQQVIEQQDVAIPDQGGPVRLTFTHTPKVAGRFGYSVRAEPVPNEISEDDNAPPTPIEVKVLSEQARVLLIAGAPTWEYRAVQRLLQRAKSVNLSCWLQTTDLDRPQDGNTQIEKLPVTRKELFEYDVIMMFDPNPDEFDEEWINLLKQFVSEHAGGTLYMAGPMFSGRFLASGRTSIMQDVLPVRLGDVGAMEVATLLQSNYRAWPLGVVAANVDQPMMRFFPNSNETLARWNTFPGIFWSFPSKDAKPTARVLIEHSDPTLRRIEGARPLLVTGQYGSGRTVFVGFNGTWRWRRFGEHAEFFNRFWIQTTRYLVEGRSLEGKRRGMIESERFRYELGDRIRITARLKDQSYTPLEQPEVQAALKIAGDEPIPVTLKPVPNQPGQYEATITARKTGRHVLSVDLSDDSSKPPLIETTFSVSLPSAEMNATWLNKPLLVELANTSGGRYFDIDQLDQVAAAIPNRKRNIDMQSKPIPLWDTNRVLLLLVGLLTIEWAVRKRSKLL